ncbi:MAG: SEC-C metal-binding domain-containing protein [Bacteroidota bacterium]
MTVKKIKTEEEIDELRDYYYDTLDETDRYEFLMKLLDDQPGIDLEMIEMFEDCPEYNIGNYQAISDFAKKYKALNPGKYAENYGFIELKLTDIAFFLKDKDQIAESLGVLKSKPAAGIDSVVGKMLYQLLFNGYYKEAVSYAEVVWKPLSKDENLMFSPEVIFCYVIYLNKLEQQYTLIQSGDSSKWQTFRKEIKSLGFDNSAERMDPIYNILGQKAQKEYTELILPTKLDEGLLIANIHFIIFMKETYNIPFILSDWWFNILQATELFKKRDEPGARFYISYHSLDKHISRQCDSFLGSNLLEMFGKAWGLHYVYEFLYKYSLITEPWYSMMTENIALFKREFMKSIGSDLWQMRFVANWPGTDIPGNLKVTEGFFNQFLSPGIIFAQDIINESFGNLEGESRIKDDTKNEKIRDGSYRTKPEYLSMDPDQPFRKEGKDVGRNDPCPCGSGKKYKKCCLLNSTNN